MAIAFGSAGAGAATETSGAALSPAWPATVNAGNIGIAHVYFEGITATPDTPSGWDLLHGPEVVQSTIGRHWIFGRVADGTEDGAAVAFGTQAVTSMRGARIYLFTGRVSGALADLVRGFSATSHATDPQMPTVTTTIAGGLACACVLQNDNNALGNATGETGGDWVEAVAEFVAALTPGMVLQLQTCIPTADPGTVTGGSVAATNDPSGVIGFEIRPELPAITGTGTPTSSAATADGTGTSSSTGTGTPTAQASAVDGTGTVSSSEITGTGTLVVGASVAAGAGTSESSGSGVLITGVAAVTGVGISGSTGTGVLVSGLSVVSGQDSSGLALYVGDQQVSALYLGSTQITRAYVGSDQLI